MMKCLRLLHLEKEARLLRNRLADEVKDLLLQRADDEFVVSIMLDPSLRNQVMILKEYPYGDVQDAIARILGRFDFVGKYLIKSRMREVKETLASDSEVLPASKASTAAVVHVSQSVVEAPKKQKEMLDPLKSYVYVQQQKKESATKKK